MTFDIYRNLNAKSPDETWSVIDRSTGRVIKHLGELRLTGAALVVQPAGAARVFATQRKHVHAFVRVKADSLQDALADGEDYDADGVTHRVTYRPKLGWDSFRYVEGPYKGQPIIFSEYINLTNSGKAYAS